MSKQRTIVYIDGFNLYYCLLRNTPYKWLNLELLCDQVLLPSAHDILAIKYFSARISARKDDPGAPTRQDMYWKALRAFCPKVEIIEGFFLQSEKMSYLAPSAGHGFVKTIKTEEKGSDVNLAVHMLNDAWLDKYDCAVMISNDSDMYESVNLLKKYCHKRVGWCLPDNPGVHISRKLADIPDFKRKINAEVLSKSLLPNPIPGTKIHKPATW